MLYEVITIVHSDRGSQYCSQDYQALLTAHGLRCSMSAKGNCYDNACTESFFHSMKVEAIHGERFETRAKMRQVVFEYIEVDYNRQRLHSTLDYQSPDAFRITSYNVCYTKLLRRPSTTSRIRACMPT